MQESLPRQLGIVRVLGTSITFYPVMGEPPRGTRLYQAGGYERELPGTCGESRNQRLKREEG